MTKVYTTQALAAALNSFTIIQPPNGTSPVADSPADTLTLTSSDNSITITGDSSTDTIDFIVNMAAVGDVDGPASATDNAIAVFNGVTGKIIKTSLGILSTAGALSGLTQLDVDNIRLDASTILQTTGANLILDYTGAAVVQLGSGVTNQKFPASRVSGLTSNPVLTESNATGQMSWVDANTLITTSLQTAYNNGNNVFVTAAGGPVRLEDNTLTGQDIFEVTDNTNTTEYFNVKSSRIKLGISTELGLNLLKFGSANESDMFFDTGLVINPKVTGSGELTIGSATGTIDGNLLVSKMGVGTSATATNSIINGVISSASARSVLNFILTYTGSPNSASITVSNLKDQGTSATFTGSGFLTQTTGDGSGHTNTNYNGLWAQMGYTANFVASTGTHALAAIKLDPSLGGAGSASITGGNFNRYGIIQNAIVALSGTPTTDVIMGCFFNDSINTKADTKIIFDSTATVLGDSSIAYVTANTDLEVTVDGTLTFLFDNNKNVSKFDFKLDTVGSGHYVKEGTNATMGVATLVAGTVVVNTTKVTANSRIFLTAQVLGTITVGQGLAVSARTAGTSFTILSQSALDTSTVAWLIMEPA